MGMFIDVISGSDDVLVQQKLGSGGPPVLSYRYMLGPKNSRVSRHQYHFI